MKHRSQSHQTPEVKDEHPERNSVTGEHLSHLRDVSLRTIQRMVKNGELTQQPDGRFNRASAIDEIVTHKMSILPKRTAREERLDVARTELLQRRLDREADHTIGMDDALETIDLTTNAFLIGFDQITDATIATVVEPGRAAAACAHVKAGLIEQFAKHRVALKSGKKAANGNG